MDQNEHIFPHLYNGHTFFFSGSSLYFLDKILVRSRLLISGWILAYFARFSIKKRKYGVKGFFGKSGCVWKWMEGLKCDALNDIMSYAEEESVLLPIQR